MRLGMTLRVGGRRTARESSATPRCWSSSPPPRPFARDFSPDSSNRTTTSVRRASSSPARRTRAIAELVKRGFVRVILTTNFDRLTEQALEAAGVSPQDIARPEAINGMAPLAHSPATVIKLHGDYKDLGSRNTPGELGEYPTEWTRLLDQVFDEYGLLISGWSADWDNALVAALEGARIAATRCIGMRAAARVRTRSASFTPALGSPFPREARTICSRSSSGVWMLSIVWRVLRSRQRWRLRASSAICRTRCAGSISMTS